MYHKTSDDLLRSVRPYAPVLADAAPLLPLAALCPVSRVSCTGKGAWPASSHLMETVACARMSLVLPACIHQVSDYTHHSYPLEFSDYAFQP